MTSSFVLWRAVAFIIGCLVAASGCENRASSSRAAGDARGDLRIISLSPAISRTLVDFSLDREIVGRTPHCKSLDQSIPVVGDLLNVDYEQIVRLKPTHILVQPPAGGVDPQLLELAERQSWTVGQWRLDGRDDIEAMVRELPSVLFPDHSSELESASARAATIVNEIAIALSPAGNDLFRGRILIVYSVDTIGVFGEGTYLHDILIALGGANASTARGWARLTLEDVVRINPQAIIVVRESPDEVALDPTSAAGPLAKLQIDAVSDGRIRILSHRDAFTPSTGIIGVASELRAVLQQLKETHP